MIGLPGWERSSTISSAVWIQSTNMTDGRTDTGRKQRPRLRIKSRSKNQWINTRPWPVRRFQTTLWMRSVKQVCSQNKNHSHFGNLTGYPRVISSLLYQLRLTTFALVHVDVNRFARCRCPVAWLRIMRPCDLDLWPFCQKVILSVTRSTASISTNFEVSMTFLSGLMDMNWKDRHTGRQLHSVIRPSAEKAIQCKSAQRRCKHCALAVVRRSQKISPRPARDDQNLISWRWSLPLPINRVWWGSMHAIWSNPGNRPRHTHPHKKKHTHTHTHRQDRLQYTMPLWRRQADVK